MGEPLNATYEYYYKEFPSVEKILLPLSEMSNSINISCLHNVLKSGDANMA